VQADAGFSAAVARAREACITAAAALRDANIPPQALAEYVAPRRVLLLFTRPATMRRVGEVWRLGGLLLSTDGQLYASGRATRAAERGRPGYQSLSREERREIAAAALRGGFAAGESVNFDAEGIPLDPASTPALSPATLASPDSPVGYADGEVRVRWRAGAPLTGAPTLATFLADRSALLIEPPFRD